MVSATVGEIVGNAERLLSDAELIYANKRYRSAASLGILALEEAGKACLVRWKEDGLVTRSIKSDLRAFHFHKQRVFACFIAAKEMLVALADFGDQFPEVLSANVAVNNIEDQNERFQTRWKQMILNASNSDKCLEFVAKRSHEKSAKYAFYAEARVMDKLKQLGFYVDVDEDMSVRAPLGYADREIAEEILALAKTAVGIPAKNPILQNVIATIYEQGPRFASSGPT